MAVRARLKIAVAISSNQNEERDLGNKAFDVYTDAVNEGGTWKTRVPAATTDLNVSLRDVANGKLLVVATNTVDPNATAGTVSLKRNTTVAEAIDIVPLSSTKVGLFALTTTGLTSIYLTNAGTVDMEVTLAVAGD